MPNNINVKLSSIFEMALSTVWASQSTGEIDFSESESLFDAMKEVVMLKDQFRKVDESLLGAFKLCMLTAGVETINDIGSIENIDDDFNLPDEWQELAMAVVNSCPEHSKVEDLRKGVLLLSKATLSMATEDRSKLMVELGNLLESYGLLGCDTVGELFHC